MTKRAPRWLPQQRKPDIARAREMLGWEPKVPLREGLKEMVEDFRKRLGPECAV